MILWTGARRWIKFAAMIAFLALGAGRRHPSAFASPADLVQPFPLAGLVNVFRYSDRLYGGSGPESPAAFDSLQRLGIRTIVSVDGGAPDAMAARMRGMRYVHLPFGYNGCPAPTAARIVKAVRDLAAPIYIHCHHGKHRGPTAVAFARVALDGLSPAQAAAEMERAGAGKNYVGLYAAVRNYRRPDPATIDRTPSDFPETAPPQPEREAMVAIGHEWERLILCRDAGWKTPPAHPDLKPDHQALLLREAIHEYRRRPATHRRSAAFRSALDASEDLAVRLEAAIRARAASESSVLVLKLQKGCVGCHQAHRDPAPLSLPASSP